MKKLARFLAERIDKSARKSVGTNKTLIGSLKVPAELIPAKKSK